MRAHQKKILRHTSGKNDSILLHISAFSNSYSTNKQERWLLSVFYQSLVEWKITFPHIHSIKTFMKALKIKFRRPFVSVGIELSVFFVIKVKHQCAKMLKWWGYFSPGEDKTDVMSLSFSLSFAALGQSWKELDFNFKRSSCFGKKRVWFCSLSTRNNN